jgi:hypothetical protein
MRCIGRALCATLYGQDFTKPTMSAPFEMSFRTPLFVRRRTLLGALGAGIFATTLGVAAASGIDPSEQRLIDELITQVENMHDITFIRNGMSYDSGKAASHMRDKLAYFRNDIHTADDFIRLCATRSEMTGLHYKVKDASGVSQDAAEFLYLRLAKLRNLHHEQEAGASAPAPK